MGDFYLLSTSKSTEQEEGENSWFYQMLQNNMYKNKKNNI